MEPQTRTQAEIRRQGFEALRPHLGVVGMVRFLQQTETGRGNYTDDRDQCLGDPDVDEVASRIRNRHEGRGDDKHEQGDD